MNETIRITRAAIRWEGKVYNLPPPCRHHDVIRHIHDLTGAKNIQGEQGFMTSTGEFVDRRKAKEIARAAGQLKQDSVTTDLFSEDLW